ncbi:hypothetical protein F5887DRAFT_955414 [Amanita rubescens]|nr:hypothetical protein F5887DRAFT_955414 [Amanita rubescens]
MTAMAMDLPPDILREILKKFYTRGCVVVHNPGSFPWLLGHICAGWRRLFLSMTMEFWDNLVIDLFAVKKNFSAFQILEFCLKCNEGYPLSFSFRIVIDMLDALIRQSMRWLKVEFYLRDAELQRLHHAKGRTLLLQSLELTRLGNKSWFDRPVKHVTKRFADTFSNSPWLTRVHLSSLSTWKFDWSTILVLDLQRPPPTDIGNIFTILPQATRLEDLTIGRIYGSENHEGDWNMITLPSLKKLTIRDKTMLWALTTPALEYLSINITDPFGDHPLEVTIEATIAEFFRRSSFPLEFLELWNVTPVVIGEVVPLLPTSLTRLELYEYEAELLVELLNCDLPESRSPIAPRLRSLGISCLKMLHQELITELIAMVDSRARNPKVDGLQNLVVCPEHTRVEVDLTALQTKCQEHKVNLTVANVIP